MRPWHTWLVFSLCLAVVLAAMGWMTHVVVRLDRTEYAAILQAAVEERIRLALWRMDSALAPLIAQESTRPYFAYTSFCPTERAYTRMFNVAQPGEILVASPLLDNVAAQVLVHFQIDPDGTFSSPQVPTGPMRELAESRYTSRDRIDMYAARLAELQQLVDRGKLIAALEPLTTQPVQLVVAPGLPAQQQSVQTAAQYQAEGPSPMAPTDQESDLQRRASRLDQQMILQQPAAPPQPSPQQVQAPSAQGPKPPQVQSLQSPGQATDKPARQPVRPKGKGQWVLDQQDEINANDENARNTIFLTNARIAGDNIGNPFLAHSGVTEGMTRPLWIGDILLLARRAKVNGMEYVQGCWLDWPGIQSWLLGEIRDLLPEARVEPVIHRPDPGESRMLAALPVRLIPGTVAGPSAAPLSPSQMSLLAAWVCVLLATGAVVVLLVGTLSLSERRAAFVSAVTHEMRTPLTTFRMYTEMLTGGMVPTEDKRRRYLDTLRIEAERLSHLVENVLAYARLERNKAARAAQTVSLSDLIMRVEARLAERAAQAGMKLETTLSDEALAAVACVDTSAVEQVLFNLVDNACKYAVSATDRRIHLEAGMNGRQAAIRVRDHGPGITRGQARRLFRPFCKSAEDAANSAPGVGLGLALSRRLARHMGGDLRLDQTVNDGACFVLTLAASEGISGRACRRGR